MYNFINILKAICWGLGLGFTLAIPVGPAGIESVKRTMSGNLKEGIKVSLGAISADLVYLLIISCGFSKILSKSKTTESFFGLFLVYYYVTLVINQ